MAKSTLLLGPSHVALVLIRLICKPCQNGGHLQNIGVTRGASSDILEFQKCSTNKLRSLSEYYTNQQLNTALHLAEMWHQLKELGATAVFNLPL